MTRKPKFIIFYRFYQFAGQLRSRTSYNGNVPHFNLILANELKTKQNEGDRALCLIVDPTGQDAKPFSSLPCTPPPPLPGDLPPPTLSSHLMSPSLRKCHIPLVSLLSVTHPLSQHSVSFLVYTSVSVTFLRQTPTCGGKGSPLYKSKNARRLAYGANKASYRVFRTENQYFLAFKCIAYGCAQRNIHIKYQTPDTWF